MESAKPAISQKEYLKRYLMKDKKTKVKKKKSISSSTHLKRSVIIDDDINIDEVPRVIDDTFSLDHLGDEAPQIVGIIDERPEQIKLEEKYQSGEWKPLKPDSRDESDEPMPDFRRNVGRQGQDDDLSPPRNTDKGKSKWKSSTVQSYREKSSDGSDGSDFRSPPRGNWKREGLVGRERHEDVRKPKESRKQAREDSSLSPSRSGRSKESSSRSVKGDDNWKHKSGDGGFSTKGVQSEDSDLSPPRPSTRDKDLNRRGFKSYKSDRNEDKRKSRDDKSRRNDRSDNYSDLSSPRPDKRKSSAESQGDKNKDEWVKKSRSDRSSRWAEPDKHRGKERPPDGSDSDLDVPRRSAINGDKQRGSSQKGRSSSASRQRSNRNDGDSDLSPPRRDRPDDHSESSRKRKTGSDSDLSPPRRRGGGDSDLSPRKSRSGKDDAKRNREKLDQMQDGKRAGLQDAKSLKDELRLLKEKEDEMFRKMDPELLGRSTAAVVRDRKTGMRRDLEKERQKEREKSAKNAVRQQKYEKWGKGLKQVREQEEKVADMVHEMSKPLARYADDVDLDRALKAQEREGDPMLEYIRRHQKESHSVDLTVGGVRKRYIGSYLPNRFSVAPGHRWDGVDRSNGYEQKWFEAKNAKKATAEEAWKWSSADM